MMEHVDRDPLGDQQEQAAKELDPTHTKRLADLSDEELMDLANEAVDEVRRNRAKQS